MEITRENTKKEINCRINVFAKDSSRFHWHENIEICRVINNPANFLVDGSLIEAKPGDIVTIGEQVVHRFLIDIPGTEIMIFQMNPKALFDTGTSIKPLKNHITAEEIDSVPHLGDRLDALLGIVQDDGGAERTQDKPYIKAIAASAYLILMHYFPGEAETKSHKERQLFYKITEFVNAHFAEEISVQTVAEKLYVSRGKIGSVFTKYSGISLNHYLNSIRVKNANMLIDSGHSITQAALDSGFQNVRTFNEVYKKMIGITPTEYYKAKK